MALLMSALSGAAYVLSGGPAVAPMRANVPAMQEMQPPKAPKAGWTLTMAGGVRTMADVRTDQQKAAKKYMNDKDGQCDLKRYQTGWTTK